MCNRQDVRLVMSQIDIPQIQDTNIKTADKQVSAKATLFTGLLAGITASACCAGPLILLMLGVSGSWISNLSALEPVRPVLMLLALAMLLLAYRKIYRPEAVCDSGTVCASRQGKQSQKIMFWIITAMVLLSISFPWYGPLLFE